MHGTSSMVFMRLFCLHLESIASVVVVMVTMNESMIYLIIFVYILKHNLKYITLHSFPFPKPQDAVYSVIKLSP